MGDAGMRMNMNAAIAAIRTAAMVISVDFFMVINYLTIVRPHTGLAM